MRRWLGRIRGALGMGFTWATAWLGAGTALWLGFLIGGARVDLLEFAVLFSVTGMVSGTAFAGVLSIAERKRQLGELSLPRFAGWGAMVGLGVSLVLMAALGGTATGQLLYAGVLTTLGAGSAAGSLALARKAESDLLSVGEPGGVIEGS